jgi:hypothetical protein
VAGDATSVPTQQGLGGDDPSGTSRAGERGSDRAEKRSIIVDQLRPFGLAPQNGELVAEHDDLELLRVTGAGSQPRERRE